MFRGKLLEGRGKYLYDSGRRRPSGCGKRRDGERRCNWTGLFDGLPGKLMETWQLGYGGPFGGKLVEGRGVICGKLKKGTLNSLG